MTKKGFLLAVVFITLITFSGCPGKDTSSNDEKKFEKIPNTLKKTTMELEQIITLLGGPMFNVRNGIEQLKNQQIQSLINEISSQKERPSAGMESAGESKDSRSEQTREEKTDENQEKEKNGNKTGKGSTEEESKEGNNSMAAGNDEKEKTEDENTAEEFETQKPAIQEKTVGFQFEDSLFGIPQWKNDNWKMIQVLSDGMYFTWNSIQPELLEKGVSYVKIEDYSSALADLSKAVKNKNITNARIAVFKLTQMIAEFFSYYKTNIPSEVQRLKSTVTGINFYVKQNNWEKTYDLARQLQQELDTLKSNVENNKSYIFQMLELSITDLEKSIQEQDPALVLIRTNLVVTNIQELETELTQIQGK
jgi:tetratricopeptide (TPR) repeat protein